MRSGILLPSTPGVRKVEWIGVIVFIIIVLGTIRRGGDWFDTVQSNARYENWWTNFEFNAFFVALCLVIFGVLAWVLLESTKPEATYTPTKACKSSTVTTRVAHAHQAATRSGRAHALHK